MQQSKVNITSIKLIASENRVTDISKIFKSLNIKESISTTTINGFITIEDDINLYESLPILGQEWLLIEFEMGGVNTIINEKDQKDIAKYIYCKDTNTPPHKGSFGDTPHIWIQKYYIIKQALYLRDQNSKN